MKKKVLGIGEIVLDKVHKLERFPQEDEKILASDVQETLGGPVPAALVLLARLGVECVLVASVADDEAGRAVKAILAREGITLLAQRAKKTPLHTVLVNAHTGSRTIIKDIKASSALIAIPKEVVQSADVVLCDRHEPIATLQAIRDKRSDTAVLMDPSVDCTSQTISLLKKMDFPIIPIETVHILFPKKSIQEGIKNVSLLLGKTVIVTMGKYGSAIWKNGELTIHPSYSVHVVDTLGAGDIFRGGFIYGLLEKWDIHRCVQFANSAAALQCTKLGNSTAIPTREEIIAFQKSAVHLPSSVSLI